MTTPSQNNGTVATLSLVFEADALDMDNIDHQFERAERSILELYWWLQIIIAREEDKLPAWEGIRVVYELRDS